MSSHGLNLEPSSTLGPYWGFKMKYGLGDCPDISETTQNSDILDSY